MFALSNEFTTIEYAIASVNRNDITYKRTKDGSVGYYNISNSFDIETSSFYDNDEKVGLMYCWQLGINGYAVFGRTFDELIETLKTLKRELRINIDKRLVIYVHNLAFEFQFIRKYFEWFEVFSIDSRRPIYAITKSGFEFRCSYILTGYTLEKCGEHLTKYKVEKLTGGLNYDLIRHTDTPLNDIEIKYCLNDVLVVMAMIQEKIEIEGSITKIPYTKTGYVRRYCRDNCMYVDGNSHSTESAIKYKKYRQLMKNLTLESNEYSQLKRAFSGGFTHSNAKHTFDTIENVSSYDFTSSYPYVMISELYPMSKSEIVVPKSLDEILEYCKMYCCVFDVRFEGLEAISLEQYISSSKCVQSKGVLLNNGRVAVADIVSLTITNIDFDIIQRCYKWEKLEVANFRIYRKGYLPTDLIKSIVKLYKDKTLLKGVRGMEVEYLLSKEMLNAIYGMCVTDIARDEDLYINHTWECHEANIEKSLEIYNHSKNRFLFYPWGVFVTAYARRNLFTGIFEFGNDYIYSDTDSIKAINAEKHESYINRYNEMTQKKLKRACEFHKIDYNDLCPKTQDGKTKLLGVWDYEGLYKRFKTLGAKRYIYETEKGLNITIAGTGKESTCKFLSSFNNPFDIFDDELTIPKEYTGKLTHTYIDNEKEGHITDYKGNTIHYKSLSGIHLEKADYNLSITSQYIDYILGVKTIWK